MILAENISLCLLLAEKFKIRRGKNVVFFRVLDLVNCSNISKLAKKKSGAESEGGI
jgi:hypothetical protein